jgi:hypothetical protein
LKTNDLLIPNFASVTEAEADVFSTLVQLSGLRPETDFQHSRLSEVDFSESDLSGFNFDFADLRRVKWEGRSSDPHSLRFSLRGNGSDEVAGIDFKDLSSQVHSKRLRWAERFFAFQILVDNWGENPDTAEVLLRLFDSDHGTYLPLCCFVYFTGSYRGNDEQMKFCVGMANAGGSRLNVFKLKKLWQAYIDSKSYLQRVDLQKRYPDDLSKDTVKNLRLVAKTMPDSPVGRDLFEE